MIHQTWTDKEGRTFTQRSLDDTPTESHPSYGLISFHHISGGIGKLFGSQLKEHSHFIMIKIARAERHHDLAHDWFMDKECVCEVFVSAAQFAEFITTPNQGVGVPCTIRRVLKENMPGVPQDELTENERIQAGFETAFDKFDEKVGKHVEIVKTMLEKKTINLTDRKFILNILNMVRSELRANKPFYVEQFQESVRKTVQHAKTEIDAMLTMTLNKIGLKTLRESKDQPKLIEEASRNSHE